MKTNDKNIREILVVPFCKNSPIFLTKKFFECTKKISTIDKIIVLFCFYVKGLFRNELNILIKSQNGEIFLLGESFLKRRKVIKIGEKYIEIVFYFDLFLPKFSSKADMVVAFDNDELNFNLDYKAKKLKQKLIYIAKNGEFVDFYSKNIEKKYKKVSYFYVQILPELIK